MGLHGVFEGQSTSPSNPDVLDLVRIADEVPSLLWLADAAGSCVFVNTEWLQFTGRVLDDELGDGWIEAVHPHDRELCSSARRSAVERRDDFDATYRLRHHEGRYRWIRHRARPSFDGGQVVGFVGLGVDVTDHVDSHSTLRGHRDSLQLALDAAGMGASIWYAESGRVEWDDVTESLFGLTPGSFHGTFEAWMSLIHPDDVERFKRGLTGAMEDGGTYHLEHRVVHPDGQVRWLERRGEVFLDQSGKPAGTRGVTMDVTERRAVAAALDRLRARLAVLAGAGGLLGRSLQIDQTISELGGAIVPSFGDRFTIDLVEDGRVRRFVTDRDTRRSEVAGTAEIAGPLLQRVLDSRVPRVVRSRELPDEGASVMVPILVRGRTIGALTVAWHDEPEDLDERIDVVADLASRAGLAITNARLFQAQRSTLIELQQSLLPEKLSVPASYQLAVRYQPGATGSEVGGDWYDADAEPSGVTHLSVGDVVGKGTKAASVMVRAHTALRTLLREQPPAAAVEQLAQQPSIANAGYLTVLAATLHPDGTAVFCNAGHPQPFLVLRDGTVQQLDIPPCPPLGFEAERRFVETKHRLPSGGRLVMYTDGLIERPGETIDNGFQRLADVLRAGCADSVGDLADRVLSDLHLEGRDDAALLIVEVGWP